MRAGRGRGRIAWPLTLRRVLQPPTDLLLTGGRELDRRVPRPAWIPPRGRERRGGGENRTVQIGEDPNPHVAQKIDGVTHDRRKNPRGRGQAERQRQKGLKLALPLDAGVGYSVRSHMRVVVCRRDVDRAAAGPQRASPNKRGPPAAEGSPTPYGNPPRGDGRSRGGPAAIPCEPQARPRPRGAGRRSGRCARKAACCRP